MSEFEVFGALNAARRAAGIGRAVDRAFGNAKVSPKPKVVKQRLKKLLKSELKIASASGQDLRTPFMGGVKMPTDDSKSFAKKNLEQSQKGAEFGPVPSAQSLKPPGQTIQDIAPKVSTSTAGSLPKLGYDMQNDPLIQYLRKQAMELETNKDDKREPDFAESSVNPGDGQDPEAATKSEDVSENCYTGYLRKIFEAKTGYREKYEDKEETIGVDSDDKDRVQKFLNR